MTIHRPREAEEEGGFKEGRTHGSPWEGKIELILWVDWGAFGDGNMSFSDSGKKEHSQFAPQ